MLLQVAKRLLKSKWLWKNHSDAVKIYLPRLFMTMQRCMFPLVQNRYTKSANRGIYSSTSLKWTLPALTKCLTR